jgi:hypothetical protein
MYQRRFATTAADRRGRTRPRENNNIEDTFRNVRRRLHDEFEAVAATPTPPAVPEPPRAPAPVAPRAVPRSLPEILLRSTNLFWDTPDLRDEYVRHVIHFTGRTTMSTQMVLRDLSRDVERGTCQLINGRRSDFTKLRGELGLEDSECRDDHELVALEGRMLASLKLYRKMFAQHREAFETQKSNLRAKAKEKRGAEKQQQQQQQPACEDECCICMSRADSWIPQPCGFPTHRVCIECAPHCLPACPFCRAV